MKAAEWLDTEMFKVIGWTLIHSLWQFLALLAALKVILLLIGKINSQLRYYIGVFILLTAMCCSALTFYHENQLFMGGDGQLIVNTADPIKNSSVAVLHGSSPMVVVAPAPGLVLTDMLNTITPYLTFGWMLGMLFYALRFINGAFYMSRLWRLPTEVYPEINDKMMALCTAMQIGRKVRLIISAQITDALTFGFLKPVILLPCSAVMQVPMEQLEMILAHELAHIKRHDYLVNMVQAVLDVIFFFNPFFRAISATVRDEREYCADDLAASYCGDRKTMAVALASLKLLTSYPGMALSAAPTKSTLHKRVNRLINPAVKPKLSVKNSFFTVIILAITLMLLTKCVYDHKEISMLPTAADPLTQLLTDNQANYKEQLFSYAKDGQPHEIFLVSTVNEKPLYAYLDGAQASQKQFERITKFLQQKRTVTVAELERMPKSAGEIRSEKLSQLAREADSITRKIKQVEKIDNRGNLSNDISRVKNLKSLVDSINKEEVKLSMAEYTQEVKNIPFDVKLHVVLTKIISNKEYTPEERQQLNELARKKNGTI